MMKLLSRTEEIVLLAAWRLKENAYGVPIRELVSKTTGNDWAFGAVYIALDKLTQKKFVIKEISEPTTKRGGRSKCIYSLTFEGKEALKAIRQVQESIWEGISNTALDH